MGDWIENEQLEIYEEMFLSKKWQIEKQKHSEL